ncbi:hypothetical protein ACQB60_07595 [Actinomycetota bacterium Odt1-20B]
MKQSDLKVASTVSNHAALIASDVGDTGMARAACREHATAYLNAVPLSAGDAIRALEPVVNLIRIQLRASRTDVVHRQLEDLFQAITTGKPATIEAITIPSGLVATSEDRREVGTWLWTVLLADGTSALTRAGRWSDALSHVQRHHGLGKRMLDGRQVAVLAAVMRADTAHAIHLLVHTSPGQAWEAAVTDCLTIQCLRAAGRPWWRPLQNLVTTYLDLSALEGPTVFHTRLGLVVLDTIDSPTNSAARQVVAKLHHRARQSADGYAARCVLLHPLARELATDEEVEECRRLVSACGLETGMLPAEQGSQLVEAVRLSIRMIREVLDLPMVSRPA